MINRKGLKSIAFYYMLLYALVMLVIGLLGCSSAKRAQNKWNGGIRLNETVFLGNAQKLAKIHYRDFASFCYEYYPAILKNDSTNYLKAKRQYDSLNAKYQQEMIDLNKQIEALDVLIATGKKDNNDSLTIYAQKQKINILQYKLNVCDSQKCETLPAVIQQVSDSALIEKHQKTVDTLTRRNFERESCERLVLQLYEEKKGKVMLPWWSLLIAGGVLAGGIIMYIKK